MISFDSKNVSEGGWIHLKCNKFDQIISSIFLKNQLNFTNVILILFRWKKEVDLNIQQIYVLMKIMKF